MSLYDRYSDLSGRTKRLALLRGEVESDWNDWQSDLFRSFRKTGLTPRVMVLSLGDETEIYLLDHQAGSMQHVPQSDVISLIKSPSSSEGTAGVTNPPMENDDVCVQETAGPAI